jgi:hypothetical protein
MQQERMEKETPAQVQRLLEGGESKKWVLPWDLQKESAP